MTLLSLSSCAAKVYVAKVNKAKANSQKYRNLRPRLVLQMMMCVVITALGYQSSRTEIPLVKIPIMWKKGLKFVSSGFRTAPDKLSHT